MSAALPLRTQGVGHGHTELPPGAAPPHAFGRGLRWLGSDVPARNASCRLAVGHSSKPPGRAVGWIFGRWERCGSGPFGTRRHPETWGSAQCVKRRAPGQSSSIAGSDGECAACPSGRCTVHRVGCGGCEVRSSGQLLLPRLDLDGLGRLMSICVARWPQTEREGHAA
jgi:hypothetical protein